MAKRRGKKSKDNGQPGSRPDMSKKMKKKDNGQPGSRPDMSKKMKKKDKKISEVNKTAAPPAAPTPMHNPTEANASAPASGGGAALGGESIVNKKSEGISGFIFMCNAQTKPECFRYRVFGLPGAKREVVQKIRAGAKLFLFDFDLKLLYGVYHATSHGQMNLEPSAFGGKFPAQVRFGILGDYLPVPEISFKSVVTNNYRSSKFDQELNNKQVKKLLQLFRPFSAAGGAPPAANVILSLPLRPSVVENQLPPLRQPRPEHPYYPGMHPGYSGPGFEPYPVQQRVISQHELYGTHPGLGHQGVQPPTAPYYITEDRHPYFREEPSQIVQEQYPRYADPYEVVPRVGLEQQYYRPTLDGGREPGLERDVYSSGYYNYNSSYPPSAAAGPPPMHVPSTAPVGGGAEYAPGTVPVSSYYSFAGPSRVYR